MISTLRKTRMLSTKMIAREITYDQAVAQLTQEDKKNYKYFAIFLAVTGIGGYWSVISLYGQEESMPGLFAAILPMLLALPYYYVRYGNFLWFNIPGGVGHLIRTSGIVCLGFTVLDIIFIKTPSMYLFLGIIYIIIGQIMWMVGKNRK